MTNSWKTKTAYNVKIDPVSGLPFQLLTLAVNTFFPTSERYYLSNHIDNTNEDSNWVGSIGDGLELPRLLADDQSIVSPDADILRLWPVDFTKYIILTSLNDKSLHPCYCRIILPENAVRASHTLRDGTYMLPIDQQFLGELGDVQMDSKAFVKMTDIHKENISSSFCTEIGLDKKIDYCLLSSVSWSKAFDKIDLFKGQLGKPEKLPTKDGPSVRVQAYMDGKFISIFHNQDEDCIKDNMNPKLHTRKTDYDLVYGFPCLWPEEANSFFTPSRRCKWPPTDVVNEMIPMGCCIVPKAHPLSKKLVNYEWRFSFSFAERHLALCLNNVCRKTYRVLKALIKHKVNWDLSDDDKFCTYYLKTILFWCCEKPNVDLTNSGEFCFILLDRLMHFVEDGNIPHFFVSSCNLIDHVGEKERLVWLQRLQFLRMNILQCAVHFWRDFKIEGDFCTFTLWSEMFHNVLISSLKCLSSKELLKSKELEDAILTAKQQMARFYLVEGDLLGACVAKSNYPKKYLIESWAVHHPYGGVYFLLACYCRIEKKAFGETMEDFNMINILCEKAGLLHEWAILIEKTGIAGYARGHPGFRLPRKEHEEHTYAGLESPESCINTAETIYKKLLSMDLGFQFQVRLKYVNFLRQQKRHEEAVHLLTKARPSSGPLSTVHSKNVMFSIFVRHTLDENLSAQTLTQHEISYDWHALDYYFLLLCYQEGGILAEVHHDLSGCEKASNDPLGAQGPHEDFKGIVLWAFSLLHAGYEFIPTALKLFQYVDYVWSANPMKHTVFCIAKLIDLFRSVQIARWYCLNCK